MAQFIDPERYRFVSDSLHGVATVALLCVACGEAEDWDGRIHVFDFLYPSFGDVQKVIAEHEGARHGAEVKALRAAARIVTTGARHGSPSGVRRALRQEHGIDVTFAEVQSLLRRLEAVGIVGPVDPGKHSHPVLMDPEAALEALR
ncbi:hypothetical protein [Streptomyces sp. NPDC001781]